jgi:mRNA-degrading endonuclease RelE of RelBE toxin-antitoxin system
LTPARWELVVAPSAERTLARLPEKAGAAVVEFMLGPLVEAPRRVGHPLLRELDGLWAARRGPYRIVYELHEEAREVRVLRIDHRADVYRSR